MSEPHIVSAARSEYDYYRALQAAEAKLFIMTNAKNKAVELLKAIEKPLRMAASELRQANLTGTPSYLEIHADNIKSLVAKEIFD